MTNQRDFFQNSDAPHDDVPPTEVFLNGFRWTMRPLDNVSLSRSVPDRYVPTLKPNYERTTSLRFLSIILRVLRFDVSEYNVYITNQKPNS
jgi:hypothetical protein